VNPATADPRAGLVAAMLDPSFYPHAPDSVELRETNTSWVFLAGPLVYKVKRPVRFPFLDYSTRERRLAMCREEVRLNRDLAPDVYLGLRAIVPANGGLVLAREEAAGAVEHAVEMRRLPEERSMARLAAGGVLSTDDVDAVARRVARFHAETAIAPPRLSGLDTLVASLEENLATLRSAGAALLADDRLRAAESFTEAFLDPPRDELSARAEGGMVRDCHGDLRAEHVILDEGVLIYDRLEFDPALRAIDIASEAAFLVMDLEALGAPWAGRRFLDAYRAAGGDPGDDPLVSFYAAYRAWVRAKIACLRAGRREEGAADAAGHEGDEAGREAQRLLALGHRFAWRARLPLVLVVAGITASGKTTLARELAAISGLPHLGSDPIRKLLAGLAPTDRAGPEHYTDEFSRRTYRELGERAAEAIGEHGGTIVDATFRRAADRDAFGEGLGPSEVPPRFVQCEASDSELLRRVRARERAPGEVSDADESVLRTQLAEREPLPAPAGSLLTARTGRPLAEVVLEVERFLDAWRPPRGGSGPEGGSR
jgi:hypothetical protein